MLAYRTDVVAALGIESGISKSEVSRICAGLDEIVAAFRGLNPAGGPKGVGDAVNQAVVITFILLFAINVIVTAVYLNLVPPTKF
jgi:phospholipid/cholesterol/gamma-HCH transport system permease protein